MTTYTVIEPSYVERERTVEEVAHRLLTDDGAEYAVRPSQNGGFDLWIRKQVANKPWTKTVVFSLEDNADKAEAEIMEKVVASGHWETGSLSVVTDEQYEVMLADEAGFEVGDWVVGDQDPDEERGKIIEIDGRGVTVAWDSQVRTTVSALTLRYADES